MATKKFKWTKTGGWDTSNVIVYRTEGGWEIWRNRVAGQWTQPALYRDGNFVLGFRTVREAKDAAQRYADESGGKLLIEIL